MVQKNVMLSSIEEVKKFVECTNAYPRHVQLVSEKYKIDAKSIMGVFSMDLSRPVTVQIEEDGTQAQEFLQNIEQFAPTV